MSARPLKAGPLQHYCCCYYCFYYFRSFPYYCCTHLSLPPSEACPNSLDMYGREARHACPREATSHLFISHRRLPRPPTVLTALQYRGRVTLCSSASRQANEITIYYMCAKEERKDACDEGQGWFLLANHTSDHTE